MSEILQVATYSIPNFIEAIIGTLIVTGILFQVRLHFNQKLGFIKDVQVKLLAVGIASIYVITQELKFHHLGGDNVYDPYDLIASVLGLILTFAIIQIFGFQKE